MTDQFLDLQVQLLVLQHGRQKVLRSLAALANSTVGDIESQLKALGEKRNAKSRSRKPPANIVDLAEELCCEHPAIAGPLKGLARSFYNRTFLPNLRDVHRFLEGIDSKQRKFKSREAAAPAVLHALTQLKSEELVRLYSQGSTDRDSDFSDLARAIMRTSSRQSDSR